MPRRNLVTLVAVLLVAAMGLNRAFSDEKYYKEMETFSRIMHEVLTNYVSEPEQKKLFEGAYRGMLGTLDPYSQYFTQTENQSFSADTEGEFGGLGIEISLTGGVLTVISPMRGTPAYEAGILAGDLILEIDGKSTERITLDEAVRLLRGKVGTEVTLTVRHPGALTDTKITMKRDVIKPHTVEFEMLDKERGIGFMRIGTFNAKVIEELREAAAALEKENMRGLILDLRQNPGGLLNMAVAMSDEFLAEGVIVSVKGRQPEQVKAYRARPGDRLENLPLVLLVDEGSASASEIVAGAIRDHKRGLLVGSRTYGKGSVQNVIPLGDGEALKLTTARYYTPNDKPILDRQGVMPDIFVPMPREHLVALRNQEREDKMRGLYRLSGLLDVNGSLTDAPAAPEAAFPGEEGEAGPRRTRVVDFQLQAAYNILRWQLAAQSATAAAKAAK